MKKKRKITIPTQVRYACPVCDCNIGIHCRPYGDEAKEKLKDFKLYQILESTFTGTTKERSIIQLNLYWACCGFIAEQLSDHNNQFIKEDIDLEIKIKIGKKHTWMIKRFKMVSGIAYIEPISISFANLKHLEANRYFDMAFKELAKMVQMSEERLIQETKERMG